MSKIVVPVIPSKKIIIAKITAPSTIAPMGPVGPVVPSTIAPIGPMVPVNSVRSTKFVADFDGDEDSINDNKLTTVPIAKTSTGTVIYKPVLDKDINYIDGILSNLTVLQQVNPISNAIPVDEMKAAYLLKGITIDDRFITVVDKIDIEKLRSYDYKKNELSDFAKQLGLNTTGSIESLSEIIYEKILSYKSNNKN